MRRWLPPLRAFSSPPSTRITWTSTRSPEPASPRPVISGPPSPAPEPRDPMTRVTLYSKPDCCLCDEVRETIERIGCDLPIELEQVDVTSDRALFDRYRERLPVVLVDGVEAFELAVDEQELRTRIERVEAAA